MPLLVIIILSIDTAIILKCWVYLGYSGLLNLFVAGWSLKNVKYIVIKINPSLIEHNCVDDSSDVMNTVCNNHRNLGYDSSLIESDGSCS